MQHRSQRHNTLCAQTKKSRLYSSEHDIVTQLYKESSMKDVLPNFIASSMIARMLVRFSDDDPCLACAADLLFLQPEMQKNHTTQYMVFTEQCLS